MDSAEQLRLAREYAQLQATALGIAERLKKIRTEITADLDVGSSEAVVDESGRPFAYVGLRPGNASVDDIALRTIGVDPALYSTIEPSVTKLRALARRLNWTDEYLSKFLIPGDDAVASVRLVPWTDDEEEPDG